MEKSSAPQSGSVALRVIPKKRNEKIKSLDFEVAEFDFESNFHIFGVPPRETDTKYCSLFQDGTAFLCF